jgi:hypothetical protein
LTLAQLLANCTVNKEEKTMATAQNISFVESPQVLFQLVEKTASVASGISSAEQLISSAKRSKVQLVSQAPRLAAPQDKPLNFVDALVAYMTSVLEASLTLAQQQSTIAQAQTTTSQAYVVAAEAASKNMVALVQQEIQDQAAEQAKSRLQTIFGYVGGAILFALGAITANPELCVMATLMTIESSYWSYGQALDQYLSDHLSNLSPAVQQIVTPLIKIAIALVLAFVVAGAMGGIQAAIEQSAEKSVAEKAFQYGFENGKGLLGYGQFFSTFTQMMVIVNPFTDIMQSMANQIPMSDASRKVFAQIMGMVVALVLAYVAGRYTGVDGAPSMAEKMAKSMTSTFRTGTQFALGTLLAGSQIASGVFSIQQGLLTQDEAEATRMYGIAQSLLLLDTSYATQVSQWIKQSQASASSVNDTFAAINNRWDSYVAPYQLSAEITG